LLTTDNTIYIGAFYLLQSFLFDIRQPFCKAHSIQLHPKTILILTFILQLYKMKWFSSIVLVALPLLAEKATASLNCTVINAPIPYYTCPDDKCTIAGQYNVGQIAELGCAADSSPPPPK
jgi:hypothetical protein